MGGIPPDNLPHNLPPTILSLLSMGGDQPQYLSMGKASLTSMDKTTANFQAIVFLCKRRSLNIWDKSGETEGNIWTRIMG